MNVREGLEEIRARMVASGAQKETLATIDVFLKRASLPAAASASANSLLQLTRMLMRTPAADGNPRVYNDFVRLEAELESRAEVARAARAAEEAKPLPKSHKFYKEQREKEKS